MCTNPLSRIIIPMNGLSADQEVVSLNVYGFAGGQIPVIAGEDVLNYGSGFTNTPVADYDRETVRQIMFL